MLEALMTNENSVVQQQCLPMALLKTDALRSVSIQFLIAKILASVSIDALLNPILVYSS